MVELVTRASDELPIVSVHEDEEIRPRAGNFRRWWIGSVDAEDVTACDADTVITDVSPLADIQKAFESLDTSPTALKSLIKVGAEA